MGAKKKKAAPVHENSQPQWIPNGSVTARNLRSKDLGGVIFGCTHSTIRECLDNLLFGLPASHYAYVRNINPGMVLFLFNYSDRKLHGIFEATTSGQMRINPCAWSSDGSEPTQYPAQVRVKYRSQCRPLTEEQFKPVLGKNYYIEKHFWFELDNKQTNALIALHSSMPVTKSSVWQPKMKNDPPVKTLPPCESQKNGISRASSNFHVLANDDSSSGDESNEAAGYYHQELVQSSEGHSFASAVSNTLPLVEETKLDDSANYQAQVSLAGLNLNRSNSLKAPTTSCFPTVMGEQSHQSTVLGKIHTQMQAAPEGAHSKFSCLSTPLQHTLVGTSEKIVAEESSSFVGINSGMQLSDQNFILLKLAQELENLKATQILQTWKVNSLEHELAESKDEVRLLRQKCETLESASLPMRECSAKSSYPSTSNVLALTSDVMAAYKESIFLVGGCDGESWLSSLNLYTPSSDIITSLKPMNSARSYAPATKLNGNLYVLGGVDSETTSCYDKVASYDTSRDQWTTCPPLKRPKGNLAATSVNGKIFAIGGGSGIDCFSEVEMFDGNAGMWFQTRSMRDKRFAPAAVEIDGIIYVIGGYNGKNYLKSAERFDHREHSWTPLESMSTARGCHSLAVLGGKIYALGGYDGSRIVSTVEVFDPRNGKWTNGKEMNIPRGYAGAAVLGESIYVMGGMKDHVEILDTVECYKEGNCWQTTKLKGIGKRCFFSAIVM